MGVASVILAILAVICGFLGPVLFGTTGVIVACVLGVIAGVLGFLKRKKEGKGGVAGIVIAVIGIIIAVVMISPTREMVTTLKSEMQKNAGDKYLVARKYVDKADVNSGFMGFVYSMLANVEEGDKAQLEQELKDIAALVKDATDGQNTEKQVEEVKQELENKVEEVKDQTENAAQQAGEAVTEAAEQVKDAVEGN